MRDYPNILVAFLEEFDEGYEFERWPHHVTILPWFKADRKALSDIESIVASHLPIHMELGATAMFGARGDIVVRLVESDGLDALHRTLLRERKGILGLINSRFVGDDYRPHVTMQGSDDPETGSRTLNELTLVKKADTASRLKRVWRNFENDK